MRLTDFELGNRLAWRTMLKLCLRNIDSKSAMTALERFETVSMLRQVCDEHGDNDWDDNLHLADVIEKHLWRYLGQGGKE